MSVYEQTNNGFHRWNTGNSMIRLSAFLPGIFSGLSGMFLALVTLASASGAVRAEEMQGQLYDIGGYRLHMTCMGEGGGPTVIFDAGLGGFSLEWLRIQRALVEDVRTCAYDRAGYGWSDPGPAPRTTSQLSDELYRLLGAAGIEPPYILVGHSFGGYNMQYFARTRPADVVAVILIDASHPEQAERISTVTIRETHRGRPQVVTTFVDASIVLKYPEDVRNLALRALTSRKAIVARQRELTNFDFSGAEVKFANDFPPVPLVVITRGLRVWPEDPLGDAREAQWRSLQGELVQLSPKGRQVIAAYSGHMVHLDEPELVAEVVRDVVQDTCEPVIRMAQC